MDCLDKMKIYILGDDNPFEPIPLAPHQEAALNINRRRRNVLQPLIRTVSNRNVILPSTKMNAMNLRHVRNVWSENKWEFSNFSFDFIINNLSAVCWVTTAY